MTRLALGTAQFGLHYGVANRSGKVSHQESREILGLARQYGIDTIDTAMVYGESEKTLGSLGVSGYRVVSKLRSLVEGSGDIKVQVKKLVERSLHDLNIGSLHGLLLHNPSNLFSRDRDVFLAALMDLKDMGLIHKIGVSVYEPEELRRVMQVMLPDLVQLPLNLMDRRFEREGLLKELKDLGIEIHARSIFLQGLLLMTTKHIPTQFHQFNKLMKLWEGVKRASRFHPTALCLSYPLSLSEVDRIVVGVDSLQQLRELLSAECKDFEDLDLSFLESSDPILINPSRWNIP